MFCLVLQLVVSLQLVLQADRVAGQYHGCILYQIFARNTSHMDALHQLESVTGVDVWRLKRIPDETHPVKVVACQEGIAPVEAFLEHWSLHARREYNLATRISMERRRQDQAQKEFLQRQRRRAPSEDQAKRKIHHFYPKFSLMKDLLKRLAEVRPNLVTFEEFDKSYENRSLFLVKLEAKKDLPAIWIDAGIHAREWIAPASAFFLIDYLASEPYKTILDKYKFYIMPVINPDGYEYSHSRKRLWRKNRRDNGMGRCTGVDLNRNFPIEWGSNKEGMGLNKFCEEIYPGKKAASEPETQALMQRLFRVKKEENLKLYLTLHAYGQYIMTAYGHTAKLYPENYEKLMDLGIAVSDMLRKKYGVHYKVGSCADILYEAAGGADDFVTDFIQPDYSYSVELPDEGKYGFLMPEEHIKNIGRQLVDMIETMGEKMK